MSFFSRLSGCFCNCCNNVVEEPNGRDNYEVIKNVSGLQASHEEMLTFIDSVTSNKQQTLLQTKHLSTSAILTSTVKAATAAEVEKADAEEAEAAKVEAAKAEAAKAETAEAETAKAETAKAETAKAETAKAEAAKAEAAKAEAAKAEAAKAEAAKAEAAKAEAAKAEAAKAELYLEMFTPVSEECLCGFVKQRLQETNIVLTQTIPGSGLRELKVTLSLAQAMNENLSGSSLLVSKTLYYAIKDHPEFLTLGYRMKLMVLGKDGISRPVEEPLISSIAKDTCKRAYLGFFPNKDEEPLIVDLCTNDYLKHNQIMFGTWEELNSYLRHLFVNKGTLSSRVPTIKDDDFYEGPIRAGEYIFPENPKLAARLNHYLTTKSAKVGDLDWQLMLQCYGITAASVL